MDNILACYNSDDSDLDDDQDAEDEEEGVVDKHLDDRNDDDDITSETNNITNNALVRQALVDVGLLDQFAGKNALFINFILL